ncbi:hypothetical protein L210DRAFT_3657822 [Boletus edulis BED1]|uniref:Fungal-type protein kinase domain-containing protein n=1 Tax=Boletus edulis BED1 TaxID=1328754 RepID=A0AAD4G5I7_BOLED|nr:hypothetical protein L210DRAFT_3657822 [Boletus edulis BED1]
MYESTIQNPFRRRCLRSHPGALSRDTHLSPPQLPGYCSAGEILHEPTSEGRIATFLNLITNEVNQSRVWSAAHRNKPAAGDAYRKPDLVCSEVWKAAIGDWSHFLSVGEHKSGAFKDVFELLAERGTSSSATKTITVSFSPSRSGGSIVSEAFDIPSDPALFFRFILGLVSAPLAAIGYDTTVTSHPLHRTITSRYLPDFRILCTLYVAERAHGRGTVVWLAELAPDALQANHVSELIRRHFGERIGQSIIIKDIWADESSSLTEGFILALLELKGVRGVPRILAEEHVALDSPDYDDSTVLLRSQLDLTDMKLSSAASKSASQPGVDGFEPRTHVRSYMTPWAVPIFQFRSGVELLGVIADALKDKPNTPFPFRFLHRDPSILNLGMVPSGKSDFPACEYRANGEHRGLLYDWGFTKVTEVEDYEFGDDDMVPSGHRTDSGLLTATPEIIHDFEKLVSLVRRCVAEEEPALEIIGTRPYMAIELLVASLVHTGEKSPWMKTYETLEHEERHDLEAFYMVLVSLCLLYDRPHAQKGLNEYAKDGASLLPEADVLPLCAVLWLTGQEELVLSNIRLRYVALCTSVGFTALIIPHLSEYFVPVAPYLERIRAHLFGQSIWSSGPYTHSDTHPSHGAFREILFNAMKTIPLTHDKFAKIMEPPNLLYFPISPEGKWLGKSWTWAQPFPTRSNNAFGFVEDQVPNSLAATAGQAASTSEELPPDPVLKVRGLRASNRYELMPEVGWGISQEIKRVKGSVTKPYRVFSPSSHFRRRQKWFKKSKRGKGKGLTRLDTLADAEIYTKAIDVQPSVMGYIAKSMAHVGKGEKDKG